MSFPVHLSDAAIEDFGRELDAIRDEVMDSRGDRDRRYLLRLIRIQRGLALGGRLVIFGSLAFLPEWLWFLPVVALGTLLLAVAKILENMEIGHNVMHAQWDWMRDPDIQSGTWEWDSVCPSDQWKHSHNVVHHTWTNVLGKDRDVGYGMLRVTAQQRWHPFYLLQPVSTVVMALLFEWFIALHDLEINRLLAGKRTLAEGRAPDAQGLRSLAAPRRSVLPPRARGQRGCQRRPERVGIRDHLLRSLPGGGALFQRRGRRGRDACTLVRAAAPRFLQHRRRPALPRLLRQPEPPDRAPSLPRHAEQPVPGSRAARARVVRRNRGSSNHSAGRTTPNANASPIPSNSAASVAVIHTCPRFSTRANSAARRLGSR